MIRRSIRWRVQLWHGLILAVILVALLVTFYRHEKGLKYAELDRELRGVSTQLMPLVSPPRPKPERSGERDGRGAHEEDYFDGGDRRSGRTERRREELVERVSGVLQEGMFFVAYDRRGELFYPSSTDGMIGVDDYLSDEAEHFHVGDGWRVLEQNFPRGEKMLMGISTEAMDAKMSALWKKLVVVGLAVMLMASFVGWILTGKALKPIRLISGTAREIAEGDRSRRIDVADTEGELGELAGVLNETFAEIQRSYERQVRFTADASHEMRTPLTVILAKCQLALRGDREPADYKRALRSCEEAAEHMRGLVNHLLRMAKLDSGGLNLELEKREVGEFLGECCDMVAEMAEERGVEVDRNFGNEEWVFDPQELRQVMLNLLSNALKYGGEEVEVSCKVVGDVLEISVRDNGEGVAEGDREHLFERFYRADQARGHQGGGSVGLGLAISKGIVEAHGGEIFLQCGGGAGTCFVVRLPLLKL